MKTINSRQHPLIKEIVLLQGSKHRKEQNRFVAEGIRTCETLFSTLKPEMVFVTYQLITSVSKLVAPGIIIQVPDEVMNKLSTSKEPSGIVAVFTKPKQPTWSQLGAGLVLANISDPGNLGTLIRSSVAFGRTSIVCVEGVDPWSPKVVQATAGTIALLAIFHTSWSELVQHKGTKKLCAMVVKDGKSIYAIDANNNLLVVGNEAHGIPQEWIDNCDEKITLPMSDNAESLNAAVAGSIALYAAFCGR